MFTTPPHGTKRINKAGKYFRELDPNSLVGVDFDTFVEHFGVIDWHRSSHAKPMARVNAGLRYYIRKANVDHPDVSQRLKRFPTIVDKLRRQPTMALSTMEDIGGVRAILPTPRQVIEVKDMLVRRWDVRRVRDYMARPKDDGYRAMHVIVKKNGYCIEIQLRTPEQDSWAQSVEQDTRRLSAGLKFGQGPDDLLEYYRLVSELLEMYEKSTEPSEEFMDELAKSYAATRRYFPQDEEKTS